MPGNFKTTEETCRDQVYTVSGLTESLRKVIEGGFPFIWVRGQVSNLKRSAQGHLYFSLHDEEASLAAVWFRRQQEVERFDPLTGEVYADGPRPSLAALLENGAEIICAGQLSLYQPRGVYQLVVELAREAGQGARLLEFERLKAELAGKGYFDPRRKRPLPRDPRRVALITSPQGAAVHDFLRLAKGRGLPAQIRLYPSLVQGEAAPASLASALTLAGAEGWAEVMVLTRGGGSLDDLWAFNSREVAEAVHKAPVPVLCGVGHEVDITLADLAADARAATPSHAAQLLFRERRELVGETETAKLALQTALKARLRFMTQALFLLEQNLTLLAPSGRLERAGMALAAERERLAASMRALLQTAERRLDQSGGVSRLSLSLSFILKSARALLDKEALRLSGLDPHFPLERGYALVYDLKGTLVRGRNESRPGERLDILFMDGIMPVRVEPAGASGAE